MTRRNSSAPHDDMSYRTRNAWMEGQRGPIDTDGLTRIWFVWQGREYMRTYERFYGPTWAARLTTAFARDVVEGRVGNA